MSLMEGTDAEKITKHHVNYECIDCLISFFSLDIEDTCGQTNKFLPLRADKPILNRINNAIILW